jgi:hypothetical protein
MISHVTRYVSEAELGNTLEPLFAAVREAAT